MHVIAWLSLNQIRKCVGSKQASLSDFLNSTHSDAFIEAVEVLCGIYVDSQGNSSFTTPSLAVMIGNIVPKSCQIKRYSYSTKRRKLKDLWSYSSPNMAVLFHVQLYLSK